ncbi:hypothetical protein VTK73DRAFT_9113 [Phialemonium thermophilum]|uniref:GPI anchored protein n=1 Tax=Phialemonium thermophilum TaxID=223376 RepID=A0ABR3W4H6_9PEZI
MIAKLLFTAIAAVSFAVAEATAAVAVKADLDVHHKKGLPEKHEENEGMIAREVHTVTKSVLVGSIIIHGSERDVTELYTVPYPLPTITVTPPGVSVSSSTGSTDTAAGTPATPATSGSSTESSPTESDTETSSTPSVSRTSFPTFTFGTPDTTETGTSSTTASGSLPSEITSPTIASTPSTLLTATPSSGETVSGETSSGESISSETSSSVWWETFSGSGRPTPTGPNPFITTLVLSSKTSNPSHTGGSTSTDDHDTEDGSHTGTMTQKGPHATSTTNGASPALPTGGVGNGAAMLAAAVAVIAGL